jgi:GNAT superfamily N-acetyltransferase
MSETRLAFHDIDLSEVVDLWNWTYGRRFRIDEEIARINLGHESLIHEETIGIRSKRRLEGFIALKGGHHGAEKTRLHITVLAFTHEDYGALLVEHALDVARRQAREEVVFGQDLGHFLPGCPGEAREVLALLRRFGFEERGEVFDLERTLHDYHRPSGVADPEQRDIRPCEAGDVESLDQFLAAEFPGRWRTDVRRKHEAEGHPGFVVGLFDQDRCIGFAVIQDPTHRLPIGGAVWRADLGKGWGALGPIGIASSHRGRGLGHVLLARSLEILKERAGSFGKGRCIVDWTTLDGFYGRHGFVISRSYRTLRAVTSMLPK